MFNINTAATQRDIPREPIFSIDGVEYTIPKEVGAEVVAQAMDRLRTEPDAAISAWCAERLIGKEGWQALLNVEGLDKATFRGIMRICRERIFGGLEAEGKG